MSTLLHSPPSASDQAKGRSADGSQRLGVLTAVPSLPQAVAPDDGVPDRSAPNAAERVADRVREYALGRPITPGASVLETWTGFAAVGREDLTVGRLVEGHLDAVRILHEAGRTPVPSAVYGVWASASGGTGLTASTVGPHSWSVDGLMRYCSGAWFIDRALMVVSADDGKRLVDVDVRAAQTPGGSMTRRDETWPAVGMDVTRSVDVDVRGLVLTADDLVGAPGFYLDRPGFTVGGVGVAAVWLGGAAGVLDGLVRGLADGTTSAHQQAHLGVMAATVAAADALLAELAERLDHQARSETTNIFRGNESHPLSAAEAGAARTAVELAVEVVLRRAPRVSGPTPLCRDAAFGHRLADLQVYVRQHHAEADYEHLGRHLVETGELLGRRFG